METTRTFRDLLQPAAKFAGLLGTVGGFIGDVLSPLGPILSYLLFAAIGVLISSSIAIMIVSRARKEIFKSVALTSLLFSIVFGTFSLINRDTENGFLSENIDLVASLQNSLIRLENKIDSVDTKIDNVNDNVIEGFESISDQIYNLSELVKNSDPLENPITPKDHIINAYLYNDRGEMIKSQESFESYFQMTKQYKVDVVLDYVKVLESNQGFSSAKLFFESLNNQAHPSLEVASLLYSSNSNVELLNQLMALQSKQDPIYKWALLTLNVSTWFEMYQGISSANSGATVDENELFRVKTLNTSLENHLELGCDFSTIQHYFLNPKSAKKLVFSNTMNNVPGYYNWVSPSIKGLDLSKFEKLKNMGCYRN